MKGPFAGANWKELIARRDARVRQIQELRAEIFLIDEELEKNPPPRDVCVAVWVRKPKAKVLA